MRDFHSLRPLRLPLAALICALLAACTSGGGGNGDGSSSSSSSSGSSSSSSCGSTVTLSGQIQAGVEVDGANVIVKDINSFTRYGSTGTTSNSYSINVGCLTPPLMVEATGSVAGRNVVLHSFITSISGSSATLNVTPLTDAMLALVGGTDASSYFSGLDFSALQAANTGKLNSALQTALASMVTASGLSSSPNFFSDPIVTTGRTGLDEVLELTQVETIPISSNGSVTGEQVQLINRLNPAQSVLMTYANGNVSQSGSINMTLANVQSFAGNDQSGFSGIDELIATLNSEVGGSSITLKGGEYAANYLNDGSNHTVQGASAEYGTPVIERCDSVAQTCLVRLGYSWQSTSTTGSIASQSYYYDTLGVASGAWQFVGDQQSYPVRAYYRFVNPVYTNALQGPVEQLAVSVDTTPLTANGSTPSVQSVAVNTVDASGNVTALQTLTPASNGLRGASSNPLTLVLPLISNSSLASSINAVGGHLQLVVTLSTGATSTRDAYLSYAMDPGATGLPNPALATLNYPVLYDTGLSLFDNWNTANALIMYTSALAGPSTSATPGAIPVGNVNAVLGYNADLTVSNPPYVFNASLVPVTGDLVSYEVAFSAGTSVNDGGDRKLLLGTEDLSRSLLVTAYCTGTNVVLNCQ